LTWMLLAAFAFGYALLFAKKRLDYRALRKTQKSILAAYGPAIRLRNFQSEDLPSFEQRLVTIDGLLPAEALSKIQAIVVGHLNGARITIQGHNYGVTVSYETLHRGAPEIVAMYHSPALLDLCSKIVNEPVQVTPLHDQSSCSILCYETEGDCIGWHR